MAYWTIIVAAGSGARFGAQKQLALLNGKEVLRHSITAFMGFCEGIVVVGPKDLGTAAELGVDKLVAGGETRSESVRRGLSEIPDSARFVLVHDGARPLVSAALVQRVIDALEGGADAVVPVVEVTDTLRKVDGGSVDRQNLVAVQTPQGFKTQVLLEAHAAGQVATDDVSLVDVIGGNVCHVSGEVTNIKITTPSDIKIAEVFLDVE